MQPDMEITSRDYKRANVVRVTGQVNAVTAAQLEDKLKEYIASNHLNLIVEMDDVNFLSSAGIRILVSAQRALKEKKGHLVISQPSEIVAEALELGGLENVLPSYETTEAAVGAF